ncbi:maleylpyruvate isomerase family mycothiol-dependent enzyme [Rhodococcus pyridinivorans]|uniref:maleylpyruvate isomerase family mycothiol-dependent enzyme n=1 Tax=Rhodococcus TaxID=1827 RepID=UPI001C7D1040|nr:maleylpyruvate isomerase family mycothiol-dependent enzyme [Rhodococcus sp. DMU2021]MBX4171762.1 maleylpyruvate isomerase family mycothiol-dependent enzyme [Rhodococcus sp. DMU2021]
MTTSGIDVAARIDGTSFSSKEHFIGLVRKEFRIAFDMLVEATDDEWHKQTPCDMWEVRDMAGHLLDTAYAYLGYFSQARNSFPTEDPLGMQVYGDSLGLSALEYRKVDRWEVLGRLEACVEQLLNNFEELTEDEWGGLFVPHRWVGPVPAYLMVAFQLIDYSIHNWDLRTALGKPAFIDEPSSDLLVPFLFGLMQITVLPELAAEADLTVKIEFTSPRSEYWTVRVAHGDLAFNPGAPETYDAEFKFTTPEFSLDVYQRVRGGIEGGDAEAIELFRKMFFTI